MTFCHEPLGILAELAQDACVAIIGLGRGPWKLREIAGVRCAVEHGGVNTVASHSFTQFAMTQFAMTQFVVVRDGEESVPNQLLPSLGKTQIELERRCR